MRFVEGLARTSESDTSQWEVHRVISVFNPFLVRIGVKFGIRALHIMLLSILKFRENRRRLDCAFRTGASQLTVTPVP